MAAQVNDLRTSGKLNPALALTLTAWLDLKGKILDIVRVKGFRLNVQLFRAFGILTQAQPDALLASADNLLLSVTLR